MEQNISYTFRKSAFDPPRQWVIATYGLHGIDKKTEKQITIPYTDIHSVRLQFQPYYRYRDNNYLCRIISNQGTTDILSTSYMGFSEFSDQAEDYNCFVRALIKKVKEENPGCPIYTGQTTTPFYGNLVLILASVLLLYVLSYYIPLSVKLLGIILLLMTAWSYLKMSFAVNKPRQVENGEIPDYILPRVSDQEKK